MVVVDAVDLARSVVDLERSIVRTRDRDERGRLRGVSTRLRRMIGVSMTKRRSAALLGVSVTALDGWVDRGLLTAVAKPGSSRLEIETAPLLRLAAELDRLRSSPDAGRVTVSAAFRRLGWRAGGRRRIVSDELAALPRPNMTTEQLVAAYESSTPRERVLQVAELGSLPWRGVA